MAKENKKMKKDLKDIALGLLLLLGGFVIMQIGYWKALMVGGMVVICGAILFIRGLFFSGDEGQ